MTSREQTAALLQAQLESSTGAAPRSPRIASHPHSTCEPAAKSPALRWDQVKTSGEVETAVPRDVVAPRSHR
eukprot:CAMPEP_0197908660 /NCGR_PEP_ID=MMETSP1439-20131203/67209_1 /TAXON_ID=66791 /ORGANISM="Gonyaulax spinifera, Strain CCMP409" /LENGTH=71 /DNA_ID=CAMNT_0043530165 /DNA_START=152 /DNA_END=363 /DNA_ORIENTATION=-